MCPFDCCQKRGKMKTESAIFPNRQLWLIATIVALAVGVPLSFFASKLPWLICVPIFIGTAIIASIEVINVLKKSAMQLPLLKMPATFVGLAKYRGHVSLSVPVELEAADQETFDFLKTPRRKISKSARIIKDESGDEIYIIDGERFVTLLVSKILPNADKVTELSFLHALQRYSEMESHSVELVQFLRDKTVLEVIKQDFRGNTAQTINRCGEAIIREMIKEAKEAKETKGKQLNLR